MGGRRPSGGGDQADGIIERDKTRSFPLAESWHRRGCAICSKLSVVRARWRFEHTLRWAQCMRMKSPELKKAGSRSGQGWRLILEAESNLGWVSVGRIGIP